MTRPVGWEKFKGRVGTELVRWQYTPNPDGSYDASLRERGTWLAASLEAVEQLGQEAEPFSVVVGRVWRFKESTGPAVYWTVDTYRLGQLMNVNATGSRMSGKVKRGEGCSPAPPALTEGAEAAERPFTLAVSLEFARLPSLLQLELGDACEVTGQNGFWSLRCKTCKRTFTVRRPALPKAGELFLLGPDPLEAAAVTRHVAQCWRKMGQ